MSHFFFRAARFVLRPWSAGVLKRFKFSASSNFVAGAIGSALSAKTCGPITAADLCSLTFPRGVMTFVDFFELL